MPAVILFENDDVIAFLDHRPISLGHTLVAPKVNYRDFLDVPNDVFDEITKVAREIYNKIEEKYEPDGICLLQNNGVYNELSHYHLHLYPRRKNDGVRWTNRGLGQQTLNELKLESIGLII